MTSHEFFRKTHRVLVLAISVLGLTMAGTGVVMKYAAWFREHASWIDQLLVRWVHNQLSTVFAIVLTLMALTGLWMYFAPSFLRWRYRRQNKPLSPVSADDRPDRTT